MNKQDTERWATIAAEELAAALESFGIQFYEAYGDDDGDVHVTFAALNDAEAMMTLAVTSDQTMGSLYDRATASCVTLSLAGEDATESDIRAAIAAGWVWTVHPAMTGRRMGWHVAVDIPTADANQVTVNLNTLRLDGAL